MIQGKIFTFEEFFDHVDDIQQKMVLHVFSVSATGSLHIYMEKIARFESFLLPMKEQTQQFYLLTGNTSTKVMLPPQFVTAEAQGYLRNCFLRISTSSLEHVAVMLCIVQ